MKDCEHQETNLCSKYHLICDTLLKVEKDVFVLNVSQTGTSAQGLPLTSAGKDAPKQRMVKTKKVRQVRRKVFHYWICLSTCSRLSYGIHRPRNQTSDTSTLRQRNLILELMKCTMAATARSKLNAFLQCNLIRVHQLKWALWCNGPLMMAVIITGDHQTWFPSQPSSVSISFVGRGGGGSKR